MIGRTAFLIGALWATSSGAEELNFQFGSKNYNNVFTTANIIVNSTSQTATYSDTYCAWHEPTTVAYKIENGTLILDRFEYKYCENRGKDMYAEISVTPYDANGCFGNLKFVWIEDGLFGDRTEGTFPAKATNSSC